MGVTTTGEYNDKMVDKSIVVENKSIFTSNKGEFKWNGQQFQSFADVRRAQLGELYYVEHGENGERIERKLTSEEIDADVKHLENPADL